MNRLLVIFAFLIPYSLSVAVATEKSALPAHYQKKFDDAVVLLDEYRGHASSLATARADLEDVLKEYASYAPAHREMARYYIMSGYINSLQFQPGSLEAADTSIKKAIDINPSYAEAFVLRGHLYRLMGRHQDAVSALEQAEKLGTTDPWLQNNWADLLIDEGKYEQAAERYRKVIDSKTPNNKAMVAAFEGLIRYYTGVGKLDQADEVFRLQIAFEPDAAWAYGNYARFLLCQKDDYEGAILRSRQALRIMDYGVGRYWLAAGLYRKWAQSVITGVPDEGKQYFAQAQAVYPDPDRITADAPGCRPLGLITKALGYSKTPPSGPWK